MRECSCAGGGSYCTNPLYLPQSRAARTCLTCSHILLGFLVYPQLCRCHPALLRDQGAVLRSSPLAGTCRPEVIVIDEIGTEAEALAARTIAQRGVQLVATAHGEHAWGAARVEVEAPVGANAAAEEGAAVGDLVAWMQMFPSFL